MGEFLPDRSQEPAEPGKKRRAKKFIPVIPRSSVQALLNMLAKGGSTPVVRRLTGTQIAQARREERMNSAAQKKRDKELKKILRQSGIDAARAVVAAGQV